MSSHVVTADSLLVLGESSSRSNLLGAGLGASRDIPLHRHALDAAVEAVIGDCRFALRKRSSHTRERRRRCVLSGAGGSLLAGAYLCFGQMVSSDLASIGHVRGREFGDMRGSRRLQT